MIIARGKKKKQFWQANKEKRKYFDASYSENVDSFEKT